MQDGCQWKLTIQALMSWKFDRIDKENAEIELDKLKENM